MNSEPPTSNNKAKAPIKKTRIKRAGFWATTIILIFIPILLLCDFSVPIVGRIIYLGKCFTCGYTTNLDEHDLKSSFTLKQYDQVWSEIKSRLEHEHLLFVLKFTAAGAVIGFIFRFYPHRDDVNHDVERLPTIDKWFRQSRGAALGCWSAVAISAIIDVRGQFNAHMISLLGSWIRCSEMCLIPPGLKGWETFLSDARLFGDADLLSAPLRLDRPLMTWALYTVTFYVFVIIPLLRNYDPNVFVRIASRAIPFCFLLFGLFGLYFYYKIEHYGVIYVTIAAVFIFSPFVLLRLMKYFAVALPKSQEEQD